MKKITLALAALAATMSLYAGVPERPATIHEALTPRDINPELISGMTAGKSRVFATPKTAALRRAAAPTETPAGPVTDALLLTPPEGTLTQWSRSSLAFMSFYGYIFQNNDSGSAVQTVETADGEVYIGNCISQFPCPGWLKATKEADGSLTIAGGQAIYTEEYEGETYTFYAAALEMVEEEDGMTYLYATADNTFRLTWNGTGYVSADPEITLGLCEWDGTSYNWVGYGDLEWELTPLTDKVTELPEGLTPEKWALVAETDAYFVDVAFDGDKAYFRGLSDFIPEAWIAATVGDGKVEIPAASFAGLDITRHWAYMYGGTVEQAYDEYWDEYYDVFKPAGAFSFTYDADARRLTGTDVLMVTAGVIDLDNVGNEEPVQDTVKDFIIEYQVRDVTCPPSDPTGLEYTPYDYEYGYCNIKFDIPAVDTDGKLMDTANLYYAIYVDGEPFTFYTDEYVSLPEDLELLPYGFTDNYDVYTDGTTHRVYFYMDGVDTYGVQAVYIDPTDGTEYRSGITEVSSVAGIAAGNAAVASSTYYDLQGRKVANPGAGLYIRRDVLTDGTVKAVKVVK